MKTFFTLIILFAAVPVLFCAGQWGITAHVPSSADFDYMGALGVGWVRIDFNWKV